MSVINPANEIRIENIGNTSITFEKINNQWMVSSLEIHRVFKEDTTMKHGTMIKQFKERKGCELFWDDFIMGNKIVTHATTAGNGNGYEFYYFNIIAFRFYVLTMSGAKSAEFRLAFITKFEELENMVARVARGEINLSTEANDLLTTTMASMYELDNLIDMGTFSRYISDNRKNSNMSNQKLYTIFKDMGYVTKDERRSTVLGEQYLTTIIDVKFNTPSVKIFDAFTPALLKRMVDFLDKNSHPLRSCLGESKDVDPSDVIKWDKEEHIYTMDNNNLKRLMDAKGESRAYNVYTQTLEELQRMEHSTALEDNGEYVVVIPSHHPQDAEPIVKDGVYVGYVKNVGNCTMVWND